VIITLSCGKQDTQVRSSTIIDHELYSITNPDNKSGGKAFMSINSLIAIVTRHKLLHVMLTQKVLFSNKREICVKYTKICYKYLIWNIYNLYIKYNLRVWQFLLLLALLSRLSIESIIHGRWMIRLAWHTL
jgi:hypothetical protein